MRHSQSNAFKLLSAVVIGAAATITPAAVSYEVDFFESTVRPLLAKHCYECHGSKVEESGLRLDHGEYVTQGGKRGPVVVPGNPAESRLLDAVRYANPDLQMHPSGKLTAREIQILTKWIEEGAEWPAEAMPLSKSEQENFDLAARRDAHWAWQPVERPTIPVVRNMSWPRGAIDLFIMSRLEAEGMRPADPADRLTLLRRLHFALTGLPPTPADIEAFEQDSTPLAYEKVVDKLLDSPRFGECWARHWLDLARYAETRGHEQNEEIQNAWRYRDYVIRAYNDDLPYDQFIMEQIAGDQLDPPRRNLIDGYNESALGTGLFWLGDSIHSPVDLDLALADRIDNQLEVTFKTFQGLSVSCARCHDHKFDAISQADYYALYGVLQGSRFLSRHIEPPRLHEARIAQLGKVRDKILMSTANVWKSRISDTSEYLPAARLLVFGGETLPPTPLGADRTLDDFSEEKFPNWQIEGDAFSHGPVGVGVMNTLLTAINPTNGPLITTGARGPVAISHLIGVLATPSAPGGFDNDGQQLVGSLTRKPFDIDRRYLHFQIAGGGDDRTSLEVIVDGEVVARAAGRESHTMREEGLDLTAWQGKKAVLRLVDRRSEGEYGYISVGGLTLSDEPLPVILRGEVKGSVLGLAESRNLDALLLSRWVEATIEQRHVLNQTPAASVSENEGATEFSAEWMADGPAFAASASSAGEFIVGPSANHPIDAILTTGWRHSGVIAKRFTGTLQSSTFTLDQPYVHVRAIGDEARLNLRVSDTQFSSPPLYEGVKKHIVHRRDTPEWLTFDATMWQGRRAYLELTDNPELDPIDVFRFGRPYAQSGAAGVGLVVLSASSSPPGPTSEEILAAKQWNEIPADEVESAIKRALDEWTTGQLGDAQALLLQIAAKHGLFNPQSADHSDTLEKLVHEFRRLDSEIEPAPVALTMAPGEGFDAPVFIRGEPDNHGSIVPRRFLTAIAGEDQPPFGDSDGRMEIAKYMASRENPLTARVMVNRIWHHLFGRGIVSTVDNFGAMSEAPSHPELLDYLATRFVELGWSQKQMIREIVLAKTFQMSSVAADENYAIHDPDNLLLHRANMRRLESEAVRDAVMRVSGRLNPRMYGPSVSDTAGTGRQNAKDKSTLQIDGDGRRSIYLKIDRNALPAWYVSFDGPKPFTSIGRRSVSNLPAQSLTMMNSPYVIEQAGVWANEITADDASESAQVRITQLYLRAYARQPTGEEITEASQFLDEQRGFYRDETSEQLERLVWRDLCHAIYNTKEFIFLR